MTRLPFRKTYTGVMSTFQKAATDLQKIIDRNSAEIEKLEVKFNDLDTERNNSSLALKTINDLFPGMGD